MRDPILLVDRFFDGRRIRHEPATIRIRGRSIASIDVGNDVPPGAIDLRGQMVMPGLINTHVHIARTGMFSPSEPLSIPTIVNNLTQALQSGTTTVADMGCPVGLGNQLREIVTRNTSAGPDIRIAGPILTCPDGYPFDWMPPLFRHFHTAVALTDAAHAQRTVEHLARRGVDHIKIVVMHQTYAEKPMPALDVKTAKAVTAEAHRLGLRVFAHAHSNADYAVALDAGVDGLAHSTFDPLSRELVQQVSDQGTMVCPTLWVFDSSCIGCDRGLERSPTFIQGVSTALVKEWRQFAEAFRASEDVLPPGIAGGLKKTRLLEACRTASANLQLLHERGVPISFGNDANYGFCRVNRPLDELLCMKLSGLSDEQCLHSATLGAARYLGLGDRGELRVGALADLVVVPNWTGLTALASPSAVMRNGQWATALPMMHKVASGLRVVSGLVKSVLA